MMRFYRLASRLAVLVLVFSFGFVGCSRPDQGSNSSKLNDEAAEVRKVKGPVKLVIRILPSSPKLSDLISLEIEVTAERDVEVKPPIFGKSVGEFLVRDYTELDSDSSSDSKDEPQNLIRRFRYQLEPVHAGVHLIRSIALEFIDNRLASENRGETMTIESDPLEILVTSEFGDGVPNLNDLAPMEPPQPLTSQSGWLWLAAIIPLAFLAGLLVWARRRRNQVVPAEVQKSPSEIAHQALAALLLEDLPGQKRFQEFYLRLTGIVRVYIEGTTGIHAPEQTTEEFLRAMRSRNLFQAEQSVRLQEFLEAADMVKYAGQNPDSDQIELSILRAHEFIDLRSPVLLSNAVIGEN